MRSRSLIAADSTASSAIGPARPRTPRSPISSWRSTAARSSRALRPDRSGWRSTTSCCGSRSVWTTRRSMQGRRRSRVPRQRASDRAGRLAQAAAGRPAAFHRPGRDPGDRALRHRPEPGLPRPRIHRPAPRAGPAPSAIPAAQRAAGAAGPAAAAAHQRALRRGAGAGPAAYVPAERDVLRDHRPQGPGPGDHGAPDRAALVLQAVVLSAAGRHAAAGQAAEPDASAVIMSVDDRRDQPSADPAGQPAGAAGRTIGWPGAASWSTREPEAADVAVVTRQLGRPPRGMRAVAHRCPCGLPDVIQTAPRLPGGEPFPTLYYLTCPRACAAASRLEAAGVMRAMTDRLAADPDLAEAYLTAHQDYARRRDLVAAAAGVEPLPPGAATAGRRRRGRAARARAGGGGRRGVAVGGGDPPRRPARPAGRGRPPRVP